MQRRRHPHRGRVGMVAALTLTVTLLTPAVQRPGEATASDRAPRANRCTISGTPAADRLVGTLRRDVICGLGGDDVIIGRSGDDVLLGGPGDDDVRGEGGADRAIGGPGADRLRGDGGTDLLRGEAGSDELDGGAMPDELDGGGGDNVCLLDSADESVRCRYDTAPPVAQAPTFSVDEVDVTGGAQTVTVTVRVSDDVGVEHVTVRPDLDAPWYPLGFAELTSGTRRDGVWTATLELDRWERPGLYRPRVQMYDSVDHVERTTFHDDVLVVRNDDPDLTPPEVELLAPTPNRVFDVRTSDVEIPVRVHMSDVGSGVDPQGADFILWAPRSNGSQTIGRSGPLRLVEGTRRDGIWQGSVSLPEDSVSGTYNLGIWTGDMSMSGTSSRLIFWSEAEYQYAYYDGYWEPRLLPDGMGGVEVLGRPRTDGTAPAVSGLQVSPSTVDTLAGPAVVDVTTEIVDAGRGVAGISVALRPSDDPRWEALRYATSLDLASGTIRDGRWTGSITLPRGAPPGAYVVQVFVWDRDQNEASYISASNPHRSGAQLLDTDPVVTVLDSGPGAEGSTSGG